MTADSRYVEGVGRRKTSVARVRLTPAPKGSVEFIVNRRPWQQYFPRVAHQAAIRTPFEVTETWGKYRVSVHVQGGGASGQAGAVTLGVARALERTNAEWRKPLRAADLLTRDPREKERKKPGLRRARRAPQWQKR